MKITSGKHRGRNIETPKSGTHPMGERERLALFNMVGNDLTGVNVLDAYAGSGALGIEALSRGANEVVFIEARAQAVKVIKNNLLNLGIDVASASVQVYSEKVQSFDTEARFGLIIADPPYDNFVAEDVARLTKFLERGGTFVLSHPGEAPILPGVVLQKSRSYAGATISIYQQD